MQLHVTIPLLMAAIVLPVPDASAQTAPEPTFATTLKADRWMEDWSWVDPADAEAPPFKNIAFGPDESWTLSLGGEGRVRAETRNPPEFGIGNLPAVNAVNFRALVHADARFGEDVRLFVQVGSWGQEGRDVPRIFDEAELALQRAFADIRISEETMLRVGRQDLFRSPSRLLFPVELFNYQLVHDAAALRYRTKDVRAHIFHGERFLSGPGVFEKRDLGGETVSGLFYERMLADFPVDEIGAYILHQETDTGAFPRRAGPEERTSWILRAADRRGPWSASAEAGLQTGQAPGADISAWAFATEFTRKFEAQRAPAVTLRIDGASGNKADTPDSETWATLAPVMGYLGRTGDYAATNIVAVYPEFSFDAAEGVRVSVGGEVAWRASDTAGLSSPGGTAPYLPAGAPGEGPVLFGAIAKGRWAPTAQWDLTGEMSWQEPSVALKDFGGEGRFNAVLSLTTRF